MKVDRNQNCKFTFESCKVSHEQRKEKFERDALSMNVESFVVRPNLNEFLHILYIRPLRKKSFNRSARGMDEFF